MFQTSFLPEKDVYLRTKSQLLATMDSMMGGRAAEELIFGPDKVTTGAANDFEVFWYIIFIFAVFFFLFILHLWEFIQ